MRAFLTAILLSIATSSLAQDADIAALGRLCVPEAPLSTLRSIVRVESSGNPNAMQIDFPKTLLKRWRLPEGILALKRQPANAQEALAWLRYFEQHSISVDVGLMQVSTAEAHKRGLDPESLLDTCTNLRAGWHILEDAYRIEVRTYGPGQTALQHALSRYNTGDTGRGFDNGYVHRVLAALHRLPTPSQSEEEKRR
jgi:type IV secretion system protein VirB1